MEISQPVPTAPAVRRSAGALPAARPWAVSGRRRRRRRPALVALAAMAAMAAPIAPAAARTAATATVQVQAPAGAVRGSVVDDIRSFKGIPYAAPPVGPARWRPPAPPARWAGVRDARQFGPACMQPQTRGTSIYAGRALPLSEDCLSLNIWAPANASKAPVLLWIHGGSLVAGSGSEALYDGTRLAQAGLVVVTINYRLGVLGWLAHPGLSAESADHVSGNYGLLDQIAALRWVQANIAAFGGDPAQVTVAGESAGALSVMYLLAAPSARGLFARAIAESAYMVTTPELRVARHGLPSAEDDGRALARALGAADIAALRAIDARQLVEQAPKAGYMPWGTIDGRLLPRQLVDSFDRGEQAPVPILAGFNSGEIRSLRFLLPPEPADAADYAQRIRAAYGDLADAFLALYPPQPLAESRLAATRDAMYGWTAERLVRKQTALGLPGYLYYFDHGYPAADAAGLHGFHAAEIPYVFDNLDRTPPHWPAIPATRSEQALAGAMRGYWASFARTGTPVAAGQPQWQPYGDGAHYLHFAAAPVAATRLLPGHYELHEQVMCRRRAAGDTPWNWNVGTAAPPLPAGTAACQ